MKKIIGFVGLIGSGKDSAADYLCANHNFVRDSFAASLKDAVASVFGWPRDMLEGKTPASRQWREQVNVWWANRLDMPHLTPRWVLQYWGTDVLRMGFHDDMWIASMENRLNNSHDDIVISDVRFPNEITAIRRAGGRVYQIQRGQEPDWFDTAIRANNGDQHSLELLQQRGIHSSEWSWAGYPMDGMLSNNSSLLDFQNIVKQLVENPESGHLASRSDLGFEVAVDNWHKLF